MSVTGEDCEKVKLNETKNSKEDKNNPLNMGVNFLHCMFDLVIPHIFFKKNINCGKILKSIII